MMRIQICIFVMGLALAGCSPLVGAMLDKEKDTAVDIPQDYTLTCRNHEECPPGHFCSFEGCRPPGKCKPIPRDCDDSYEPLCGCDNVTYENECKMEKALQSRDYGTECMTQTCTFGEGDACPAGSRCYGDCGSREGQCVPEDRCDGLIEHGPACGCPNPLVNEFELFQGGDCDRFLNGAWKAPLEKCDEVSPCSINDIPSPCNENEFCEGELGYCEFLPEGWCEPKPSECSDELTPVCGCDNVSYLNDCMRKQAGVRLFYDLEPCVCGMFGMRPEEDEWEMNECVGDQFCEVFPEGCMDSGIIDPGSEVFGYCVSPFYCQDWMYYTGPVCGCDVETYDNDCLRRNAGTSRACMGQCPCDDVF